MKKLSFLIVFLLFISCHSQTTYSEEQLKRQSEKILEIQKNNKTARSNNRVFVKDIVKNLNLKIISFGISPNEDYRADPNKADLLRLKFYSNKEFRYKKDNKIQLYTINIYFKKPQDFEPILKIARKYGGKWNDEVADFFADIEVDSVTVPMVRY